MQRSGLTPSTLRSVAVHLGVAKWGYALASDEGWVMTSIEEGFLEELAQIKAQFISCISLLEGAYLYVGSDECEIQVVGWNGWQKCDIATLNMSGVKEI